MWFFAYNPTFRDSWKYVVDVGKQFIFIKVLILQNGFQMVPIQQYK